MIRRAILATTLVSFLHTGSVLLFAGPSTRSFAPKLADRNGYLNPLGVALSSNGRSAYVALSGIAAVAEVDLVTGRTLRRFETGRRPRQVRRDETILTVIDDRPGALLIALPGGQSWRVEKLPPEAALGGDPLTVAIPADRKKNDGTDDIVLSIRHEPAWDDLTRGSVTEAVFENHLRADLFHGPFNTRAALIGVTGLTAPLDRANAGAAQPSVVVWDQPFNTLFVAMAGSDSVLALSPDGLRTNLKAAADGRAAAQAAAQSFWGLGIGGGTGGPSEARPPVGLVRVRLPTQPNPRAMALSDDGRTLVVSNTLSDSLTVIAVGPGGAQVVKHIPLGGPEPDAARRGEVLFHSVRLSFNGRFACSSCHPGGGSDGRTWITPTEDAGFARQTKSLFGVRDTAPYGWHGDSPSLADRVQKTLTKLHKHTPKKSEVRDLVAYLESLDPPEPAVVSAEEKEAVRRGRELFEGRARCSRCHSDERLCDGKQHDVGTEGFFDTPSLRGVRDRWPLLHNGKANQPRDIFLRHNGQQKHGAAHELDESELNDLMAYLKTL
jgi:cytochrome c peroxidase